MVVLHADELDTLEIDGVLRRQVVGVQVVGDHLGVDAEEPAVVLDALGEGPHGLVVLEIADVVADERAVVLGQTERVLQLGPAGEHRPGQGAGAAHGPRRVAA